MVIKVTNGNNQASKYLHEERTSPDCHKAFKFSLIYASQTDTLAGISFISSLREGKKKRVNYLLTASPRQRYFYQGETRPSFIKNITQHKTRSILFASTFIIMELNLWWRYWISPSNRNDEHIHVVYNQEMNLTIATKTNKSLYTLKIKRRQCRAAIIIFALET